MPVPQPSLSPNPGGGFFDGYLMGRLSWGTFPSDLPPQSLDFPACGAGLEAEGLFDGRLLEQTVSAPSIRPDFFFKRKPLGRLERLWNP